MRQFSSFIACSRPLIHSVTHTFFRRTYPSPSNRSPLIWFRRQPQKRNSVPSSSGSIPYSSRMIAARPSIPRLKSVLPVRRMTRLKPSPSLSIRDRFQDHGKRPLRGRRPDQELKLSFLKDEFRNERPLGRLRAFLGTV